MADHLQKKEKIRVTGHIAEVRSIFHIKLSWTDATGKRCRKSISTGLGVKGNTKRAGDMLRKVRKEHEILVNRTEYDKPSPDEMLFADFMEEWLDVVRHEVKTLSLNS